MPGWKQDDDDDDDIDHSGDEDEDDDDEDEDEDEDGDEDEDDDEDDIDVSDDEDEDDSAHRKRKHGDDDGTMNEKRRKNNNAAAASSDAANLADEMLKTQFSYRVPGTPSQSGVRTPDWDAIQSGTWVNHKEMQREFNVDFPKPMTVPTPLPAPSLEMTFVDTVPIQIAVYANKHITLLKSGDVDTHEHPSSAASMAWGALQSVTSAATSWLTGTPPTPPQPPPVPAAESKKQGGALWTNDKPTLDGAAAATTSATTSTTATFYLSFSCLFDSTHVLNMTEEDMLQFFTNEAYHRTVMARHIHANRLNKTALYGTALSRDGTRLFVQRIVRHNLRLFVMRMFPTQAFRSLPVSTYASTVLREPSPMFDPAMRTQLNTFATYQKRYFIRQAVIVDDIFKNPLMRFVKDQFAQTAKRISSPVEPWTSPHASFREVDWVDRYITTRYRVFFKALRIESGAEIDEEYRWVTMDKDADREGKALEATHRFLRLFPIVPPVMTSARDKHLLHNAWIAEKNYFSSSRVPTLVSADVRPPSEGTLGGKDTRPPISEDSLRAWKQRVGTLVTRPPWANALLRDFSPLRNATSVLALLGDSDLKYFNDTFRQMCSSVLRFSMAELAKTGKTVREVALLPFENDFLALLLTLNFLLHETDPSFQSLVQRAVEKGHEEVVAGAKAGAIVATQPHWFHDTRARNFLRRHVCYFPFAPNMHAANQPLVLTLQLDLIDSVTLPRMCSLSRAAFSNHILYSDDRMRLYPLDFMFRAQMYSGGAPTTAVTSAIAAAAATGDKSQRGGAETKAGATDKLLLHAIADARASGMRTKALESLAGTHDSAGVASLNAQTLQQLVAEYLQLLQIGIPSLSSNKLQQKSLEFSAATPLGAYKLLQSLSSTSTSSSLSGWGWGNTGSSADWNNSSSSSGATELSLAERAEEEKAAFLFLREKFATLADYLEVVMGVDANGARKEAKLSKIQFLDDLGALPSTNAAASVQLLLNKTLVAPRVAINIPGVSETKLAASIDAMKRAVDDKLTARQKREGTFLEQLQSVAKDLLEVSTPTQEPEVFTKLDLLQQGLKTNTRTDKIAARARQEYARIHGDIRKNSLSSLFLLSQMVLLPGKDRVLMEPKFRAIIKSLCMVLSPPIVLLAGPEEAKRQNDASLQSLSSWSINTHARTALLTDLQSLLDMAVHLYVRAQNASAASTDNSMVAVTTAIDVAGFAALLHFLMTSVEFFKGHLYKK